jgi:hypothetical protein
VNIEPAFLVTARPLDRLVHHSHADSYFAAFCAIAACVALAATGFTANSLEDVIQLVEAEMSTFVIVATVFALGGFATVRMWRKLWRRGRDRWEVLVFGFGVRGVGAGAVLLILGWCCWQFTRFGISSRFPSANFAFGFLTGLVTGVPVGLGFGYFWGMSMATLFGIKRSQVSVDSEPPLVSDEKSAGRP